jgi:hypothetical protein
MLLDNSAIAFLFYTLYPDTSSTDFERMFGQRALKRTSGWKRIAQPSEVSKTSEGFFSVIISLKKGEFLCKKKL